MCSKPVFPLYFVLFWFDIAENMCFVLVFKRKRNFNFCCPDPGAGRFESWCKTKNNWEPLFFAIRTQQNQRKQLENNGFEADDKKQLFLGTFR